MAFPILKCDMDMFGGTILGTKLGAFIKKYFAQLPYVYARAVR